MGWTGLEEAVAIADAGSFVGGARSLGVSASHVSRAIAQLEARLGAKLFARTTRSVRLTDTGRAVVEQSRRIIAERDELLANVNGRGEPQGELRITCSTALGEWFVAPIVRHFAELYPRTRVSLDLTNRVVDLIGEAYDLGIRTGHLADARLAGRKIAMRRVEVCASPAYLRARGAPRTIDDVMAHDCLIGTSPSWRFTDAGRERTITPPARWRCNSGTAVAEAAVAGLGLCQLPDFYVGQAIADGRLARVLDDVRAQDEPVWAVYPQRRHLLPKVRNLVDLLDARLGGTLPAR
ncbi:LysR family transcriptional regulator [Sphingomonas profundi]|uniref:LysR family transcriptional regulator n=1 Tax=Alterirhizorhabdus profundi TaxID=2681549 RepID=UPI0012E8BF4B|nr:LysR family transcriptional regulator [Sphingomonas profundi]